MNTTEKLSAEQLASLGKYDTPTICNAIELFDIRPRTAGYMDGTIRCCFPQFLELFATLLPQHVAQREG